MSWSNSNSKINTTKPLLSHISYNCTELESCEAGWWWLVTVREAGIFSGIFSSASPWSAHSQWRNDRVSNTLLLALLSELSCPWQSSLQHELFTWTDSGCQIHSERILRENTDTEDVCCISCPRGCSALILLHNIKFSWELHWSDQSHDTLSSWLACDWPPWHSWCDYYHCPPSLCPLPSRHHCYCWVPHYTIATSHWELLRGLSLAGRVTWRPRHSTDTLRLQTETVAQPGGEL